MFDAQPKLKLTVECRDKDGNLKWTDEAVIEDKPEPGQKEPEDGKPSND